jgi:hypothetical protein
MGRDGVQSELPTKAAVPTEALAAPDPEAAIRNAAALRAEANTRPKTLARVEKLRDKVWGRPSFFDSAAKHPAT